jgi:hypothetical protein
MKPNRTDAPKPALAGHGRSRALARQNGQVLVIVILMFVVLIGAVGLSVDIGNAVAHQRTDQGVADSAALAAADRLYNGMTLAAATSAATNVATLAGVPSGNLTMAYLDGSRNPTTNPNSVVWVQAKVNESVPTFFFRAIGIANSNVASLAEAKWNKKCTMCLLDLNASPAADLSSGGSINVNLGCLQVNSNANPATTTSGGAGAINAPCTNIVGTPGTPALINPAASTGVPPVPDPLAKLPYPILGGTCSGGSVIVADTNVVISPGCYTDWQLGSSGSLYLNPGIYVLTGLGGESPGIAISSNGSIKNCKLAPCPPGVTAGGVMIFFTCSPYYTGSSPSAGPICPCPATGGADIVVSANGSMTITAPTSGTYQGIAIFFDRCNNGRIELSANGSAGFEGAIYAKAAPALITANGNLPVSGLFITATVKLSSNASLIITYDPTQANQQVNANWLSWGSVRLIN